MFVIRVDSHKLAVEDLSPLVGLPSLRAVTLGLGSVRRNDAGRRLLGLPDVTTPDDWRDP